MGIAASLILTFYIVHNGISRHVKVLLELQHPLILTFCIVHNSIHGDKE